MDILIVTAILRSVKSGLGVGGPLHYAVLDLQDWDDEIIVRRRLSAKFGIEPVFYRRTDDHAGLSQVIHFLYEQIRKQPLDPLKGRWGGQTETNGRRITGKVRHKVGMMTHGLFSVDVWVESTDSARPLVAPVTFHLPESFVTSIEPAHPIDGRATLHRESIYAPFTLGAETDSGETRLELDLATLPDLPERFLRNARHMR